MHKKNTEHTHTELSCNGQFLPDFIPLQLNYWIFVPLCWHGRQHLSYYFIYYFIINSKHVCLWVYLTLMSRRRRRPAATDINLNCVGFN